jgi:hypothetical protein
MTDFPTSTTSQSTTARGRMLHAENPSSCTDDSRHRSGDHSTSQAVEHPEPRHWMRVPSQAAARDESGCRETFLKGQRL